ncbi:uncharacterized protein LOC111987258 [Quercus suber]|uniref:Late embryogenesis abundant protein LEA-2 subgroup domain-containing protein n=1 Tax=Quercus suber TaxID=58331 RepID=A0AAW0MC17_QUESU|nr:uncharacterized protein LOC111987258 [Quercus suber]POE83152.1 hypothetical protein CFP56_66950 [Quercus suber]
MATLSQDEPGQFSNPVQDHGLSQPRNISHTVSYAQSHVGYDCSPNAHNTYPYATLQLPAPHRFCNSGCIRCCIVISIVSILFVLFTFLLAYFVVHPDFPVFVMDTFYISNFINTSNPKFTADWEANILVNNPSEKLKVHFDGAESYMFYQSEFLATSNTDLNFHVKPKGHSLLHVKMSTNDPDQPEVKQWVVDAMSQDRNEGSLSFNMRMLVSSSFKAATFNFDGNDRILKVYCDNLDVVFVGTGPKGFGILSKGQSKPCSISM